MQQITLTTANALSTPYVTLLRSLIVLKLLSCKERHLKAQGDSREQLNSSAEFGTFAERWGVF